MVIDFEHHLQPYEIWKRRGGKPGQTVMMKAADGSLLRPLDDSCLLYTSPSPRDRS